MTIPRVLLLSFVAGAILLDFSGCSSESSMRDQYMNLDYDAKAVLLTYYPYLSEDQRNELLTNTDKDPKELIQDWAGQFNDPDHNVGSFDEMMNNPANRKIKALEITLDSPEPVASGDHVLAHAFALYANGKRVEVTAHTEWKVEPRLGKMDKNKLEYECVNSDLTITGMFLGERDAARTVKLRKPIQSLEMKVSEAYVGVDTGYNFQLNLIAHCQDGSTSDVSCQANWRSAATGGRIEGCGNFVVSSKEKLRQDSLTVLATYGNLSVRKTLHPPIR